MDTILAFLAPLWGNLLDLAAALLLGLGTVLVARLSDWLRLANDDKVRAYLVEALERAVDYAEAEARRVLAPMEAGDPSPTAAQLADLATDVAAQYVRDRVPDALRRFGVTDQGLVQMVQARLALQLPAHG